jgi:hypothetical protein
LQQPNLLQQPRHQSIQPGFWWDEDIAIRAILPIPLSKLDFMEF